MKILVVGLGSMGRRRVRLILNNYEDIDIVGVDKREDRRREAEKRYNIKVSDSVKTALKNHLFKAVIVCTSPLTHYSIIKKCLTKGLHVFTELNLTNRGYNEFVEIAREKRLCIFLSSTMLYRREIEYINKRVKTRQEKVNYRYHVGQYLPDWHPWESIEEFFVKDKKTNGCREFLAIELPWIINTFGRIEEMYFIRDKISKLNVNYPDNYNILFKHESGHLGNINVDVVARKAIRDLEIYSDEIHLFWDGTPTGLKEYDIDNKELANITAYNKVDWNSNYAKNIIENAYLEELKEFINELKRGKASGPIGRHSIIDDLYVLSVIDKIEV